MATTYDTDFYAWTQETAQAIRERRWEHVDTENLLEEIESLGRSERRSLTSQLEILLAHLLERRFQAEKHTRSWELAIRERRLKISQLFEESPSLGDRAKDLIQRAYQVARLRAARETGLAESVFPEVCPWTEEQVVNESNR